MGGLGVPPPDASSTILSLTREIERTQREEQERKRKEAIDALIKINGAFHSFAMIYNNAIILAGYAVFFGIWAYTKQFLPAWAMQLTAVLMGLSAMAFVGFEIYKMTEVQKLAQTLTPTLKVESAHFFSALAAYQHSADETQIRLFQAQRPVLLFTLVTGFGAGLILVVFFAINLFRIAT